MTSARRKRHHGFATGDRRISVRASGKHGPGTPVSRCAVSHVCLRLLPRTDGYAYSYRQEATE
ncbi:hypothetical protein ACIQZB_06960 [Streptomyces sp. NPDC097727]|uniref:hypothetical protein n=1 Tax=Streptomyces sp. NPDC097727 TaxID=3366092 RepID=UPI00382D84AD